MDHCCIYSDDDDQHGGTRGKGISPYKEKGSTDERKSIILILTVDLVYHWIQNTVGLSQFRILVNFMKQISLSG